MKNKFFLLAIVSALFALIIVPSALAQSSDSTTSDVDLDINAGEFSFLCSGSWSGAINFELSSPPVTDASVTKSFVVTGNDWCEMTDYSDFQGAKIKIAMQSNAAVNGDFSYTGSATQADIPYYNLKFYAKSTAFQNPSWGLGDTTANTVAVNTTNTADAMELSAYWAYPTSATFANGQKWSARSWTGIGADTANYIEHIASQPVQFRMKLEKILLDIPGGSNPGAYKSTIYMLAVDGLTPPFTTGHTAF